MWKNKKSINLKFKIDLNKDVIKYSCESSGNISINSNKAIDSSVETVCYVEYDSILKQINKTNLLNRIANILIFLTLFVNYIPIFSLTLIMGIILKIVILASMKIELYYTLDEESQKMYDALKEFLMTLFNSKKIWQILFPTKGYNTKHNAEIENVVERKNIFIKSKLPWYIKTNINIYGLKLKKQKMFFMPDRVIVFKNSGSVFACSYKDIHFEVTTISFIESERVYKDTEIVNYTWKYANKYGGRDLRFSNNIRLPICRYGRLTIISSKEINIVIYFSNHNLSSKLQSSINLFNNEFNRIYNGNKKDNNIKQKIENVEIDGKTIINNMEEIKPVVKNNNYKLPPLSLLKPPKKSKRKQIMRQLRKIFRY